MLLSVATEDQGVTSIGESLWGITDYISCISKVGFSGKGTLRKPAVGKLDQPGIVYDSLFP